MSAMVAAAVAVAVKAAAVVLVLVVRGGASVCSFRLPNATKSASRQKLPCCENILRRSLIPPDLGDWGVYGAALRKRTFFIVMPMAGPSGRRGGERERGRMGERDAAFGLGGGAACQ